MTPIESRQAGTHDGKRQRELERALERKNNAFEALFRLFDKLGTTFEVDTIIRLFLMTLAGQLGLERIAFYSRNPSGNFELYHTLGITPSAAPPRLGCDSAFVGWIERGAPPALIEDFLPAAGYDTDGSFRDSMEHRGFRYASALRGDDASLGLLFFGRKIGGEGFSVFDVEFLRMVIHIATITLRNAFLYQAMLRSKGDIETFSKVKKEFISHTSHELRTPLTVLKSSLWSIETEDASNGLLVDMAKDAVLRMQEKVDQVLSLNEMELGEQYLERQPAEMSQIVEDMCRAMIPEFEEREITVRVDDRARNREALLDASKMKIVLRSLLDNALSSVDRRGIIEIILRVSEQEPNADEGIEITSWPGKVGDAEGSRSSSCTAAGRIESLFAGPWLVVRVKDNGRGIPSGEIRAIVEPFRRASNSAVSQVRGFGLGLSVSQRIIAGHGGRFFCKSEEGRGAEFSVWMPL